MGQNSKTISCLSEKKFAARPKLLGRSRSIGGNTASQRKLTVGAVSPEIATDVLPRGTKKLKKGIQMNRRSVSTQFANVFVLLDELSDRVPADLVGALEMLRYEISCARDVSIGSCVSGAGVAPEVLRSLINNADAGMAQSHLQRRLLLSLHEYSPFNVSANEGAALLTRLVVTTPAGMPVEGAAELAMLRYCNLLTADECSLDAQYIEIILRESLGLSGDLPVRDVDIAMRKAEAQAFLNYLQGFASSGRKLQLVA